MNSIWINVFPAVLHAFGDTICGALRYDNDHIHHFDAYKIKVADGIAMFKRLANCRGLCEVSHGAPSDIANSPSRLTQSNTCAGDHARAY